MEKYILNKIYLKIGLFYITGKNVVYIRIVYNAFYLKFLYCKHLLLQNTY